MLQPKVGDTVVCELEVSYVGDTYFSCASYNGMLSLKRIVEIKPAPFKVGDLVWWIGCEGLYEQSSRGHILLYIHKRDNRKFAVVAFGGDIPKSVWFKDLRRSHSECVG